MALGLGNHRSFHLEILGVCPKVICSPCVSSDFTDAPTLSFWGAEQLDGCFLPGVERNEGRGASSGPGGTDLADHGKVRGHGIFE